MANIDVEDESILTAIFKDSFPESWKENQDFVHYLSELSSFGLEKLAGEPDRLMEEKSQVLKETQNLAFQHYKTFIQTAECSREIFEDFQIIEKHVGSLLEKLPKFSEDCNKVLKKAQEISSSRRMNSLTLQRHTQLLEVLEVPQLMDTCVRNGYFDEALELASHVKRLEKKHSNIPVITNIVTEVKNSAQLMLNQLIQQLRTNIQLPACLRVIGYLRRMDVFTEAELRIKFLQARDTWFQGILRVIPWEDAYVHITKTIEASRVHLFDIVTQYRAIFSDEDPILSTGQDDSINEAALFHGWIVQKVSQFLTTLEEDLSHGVGGRLDSILGQCMYFGLSFSRVGADFRGLLAPIFQRAALNGFISALSQANKRFEENMRSYNLLSTTATVGSLSYVPSGQANQLLPPMILLDFYPLAAFCNDVLTAFNELRLCAPLSLACNVAQALQTSTCEINRIILAFNRAEETTFDKREQELFRKFCSGYAQELLPYFNHCLQLLFPVSQLAQVLGVSASEVTKMGTLAQIDISAVVSQIQHLVPKQEEKVHVVDTAAMDTFNEQSSTVASSGVDPSKAVVTETSTTQKTEYFKPENSKVIFATGNEEETKTGDESQTLDFQSHQENALSSNIDMPLSTDIASGLTENLNVKDNTNKDTDKNID
ncbi:hypothetical protein CHS0354_042346 [Potamilus streckersoni]|uniref:Conserved oligomeric Golgi complex subunit 8 n=1 Tax=Potamilus streckersoni TaxID=2493646 RepID=A0AAE0W2F4_9BIVA|nr:hypothetical protein CHS0354_042346 [Potamilus streckersoni]